MKAVLTLLAIILPLAALADEPASMHPYLGSKFFASVGLFRPDQKMGLRLDASVDIPDPEPAHRVDFSKSFGFSDDHRTGSAEIGWRFGKKWQLRGQYFRVDNDVRATLQEDVQWGDYVFNQGTSVGAGTEMQITRLFFGRKFSESSHHELGFGIGGHILDISAYINGNATVDGVDVGFRQERASISQPLPNIGAWYVHAFSQKWVANVRVDWLSARVGDYDGSIANAAASIGYAMNDHFGVRLAYNFFQIDLKIRDPDWSGRAKVRFDGPYIALTGYW